MADSNISRQKVKIDITGQRFGRWVAIEDLGFQKQTRSSWWGCRCDCGRMVAVCLTHLRDGTSRSCGCLRPEATAEWNRTHKVRHGATIDSGETPEYAAYRHAKARCTNPRDTAYKNYGGRGIRFKFKSFEQFLQEVGPKPDPSLTLERIKNNGHYEPGNVVWADRSQQCRNQRRTKLTADDVRTIRSLLEMGIQRKALAKVFNVSITLIRHIAIRRVWASLPL